MSSDPVEEIKERLDIVDVIRGYLKLEKTGANYRAICPFHSEESPSFFVSPARQIWHCFGCSEGGDMFEFVKKIEGIEFGEALKILADKAGVELKRQNFKKRNKKKELYEICDLAATFFQKQLEKSKTGKKAKKYLLDRNISEDSIKKWRLVYAPANWRTLLKFLENKGYERDKIVKTGLVIRKGSKSSSGMKQNFYDRFRGRIMFPVFNLHGQAIGFGGRILGKADDTAKYLNTPNTPLYDKSKVLYGLNEAKVEIRKRDNCILVEGYTDVIMSHQAGVKNVIATSGTALTARQLKILKRYSDNLTTAFDMDLAGDSATKRGIDMAQAKDFDVRVIMMPEDSDPADMAAEDPKKWKEKIKDSKSIFDYYFETTFAKYDKETPKGKKKIAKVLLPVIKQIPNKIEQSQWIQRLAEKFNTKEENIEAELKKVRTKRNDYYDKENNKKEEKGTEKRQKSRLEKLQDRIVSLAIKDEKITEELDKNVTKYFTSAHKEILNNLKEDKDDFKKDKTEQLFNYLSLKADVDFKDIEPKEEFKACLKQFKKLVIKKQLTKISKELYKAEKEENEKKVEELSEKFNKLSKKIREKDE